MPEAPAAHLWHPIAALSEADLSATDDHLPALMAAWEEARADLNPREVEGFNQRLNREWAIETGIIEDLYTLDRGTTQLLIERGIKEAANSAERRFEAWLEGALLEGLDLWRRGE